MTEKYVIIHRQTIENWKSRTDPPLPLEEIDRALARIDEVVSASGPDAVVVVEESPATGFITLPALVGSDNSVVLLGARAGYCLRQARIVLEEAGISVRLDIAGSLP